MTEPTPTILPRPSRAFAWDLLAAGAWWGIVGGVVELLARGAYWAIRPRVTVESIRTNHHHLWMIPASDVLILSATGLGLALVAKFAPATARRFAPMIFASLASIGAIRTVHQLHSASGLVLALGLGAMAMRAIVPRETGYRRMVRVSLVPLLVLLFAWSGFQFGRVVLSERRALAALPSPAKGSPNVLLIVMDNVRVDDLSLYGYSRETSPNLKKIAERGAKFDRARSTASWTLPSHASMLTGRWPHELSVTVDTPLDDQQPTLAENLSARGYATAGFVANTYYCNAWYGLDRGFSRYEDFVANSEVSVVETMRSGALGHMLMDKFKLGVKEWPGDPKTRKSADRINGDLLGWLDERGKDRPFFAFLNYYDAHEPFQPPKGSPRKFGLSALPESERAEILRAYGRLNKRKPGAPVDPNADAALIAKAAELLRDSYDDCIAALDVKIGQLIDDLDRRGVLDNTLVILTADHGEEFNEKSLFGHGVSVYRPEVHVPLIVLPPKTDRSAKGRVIAGASSLRDIPATVMGYVDRDKPSPLPGTSLARFWTTTDAQSGPVLSEVEHQTKFAPNPSIPASLGPVSAIVEGRYVYIKNADGREEVYDHELDPAETSNLASDSANTALIQSLREGLARVDSGRSAERVAARPSKAEAPVRR